MKNFIDQLDIDPSWKEAISESEAKKINLFLNELNYNSEKAPHNVSFHFTRQKEDENGDIKQLDAMIEVPFFALCGILYLHHHPIDVSFDMNLTDQQNNNDSQHHFNGEVDFGYFNTSISGIVSSISTPDSCIERTNTSTQDIDALPEGLKKVLEILEDYLIVENK